MALFRSNSDDTSPMSEINITPLVDVMLVLLVIFMVCAPMMETGIPIQLPKTSAKALTKGEAPTTLHLDKNSRIYLEKEEIALQNLPAFLEGHFKNKQQKEIFIRADGSLPYSFVAQTMALVKQAGISKIGLVTVPLDN